MKKCFYILSPDSFFLFLASTSLRHNTVEVWEICAYKEKKQGGQYCDFTYLIWKSGFTRLDRVLEEISTLQYGIINVLWDTDSFAEVERRGRHGPTDLNPLCKHRTAGTRCQFIYKKYFLNAIIYKHHTHLYLCSIYGVGFRGCDTGRDVVSFFICVDYKGNQANETHLSILPYFLFIASKIKHLPTIF